MKTSSMRTAAAIFSAGILLTSCVSSKKYHRSQDEVARLRQDSTSLAQKGSTLQQNLTATEQKNADLQKSLETAGNTNSGLQKNVAYYTDYASKQESTTSQIRGEMATNLASAGITDQDVIQSGGKIYVNIGEKSLFKGNTAMLSAKGKELVENLGQFVKSHEAVDVSVADLEMAGNPGDASAATTITTSTDQSATTTTTEKTAADMNNSNNRKVARDNAATNNNADYTHAARPAKHVAVHHAKKTVTTSTSTEPKAVAYSSNHHNRYNTERLNRSAARAMAWKRQNAVADALLKDGIPKVKLVSQLHPSNGTPGTQKGVQVVLVNGMDDFYKHMTEAPASQPVSRNP